MGVVKRNTRIVWGGLIFVAPSYILPNIFRLSFYYCFPFTAPSEETLQILHLLGQNADDV